MSIKDNKKTPLKGSLKEWVASDRTVAWQHDCFRLIVEFGCLEFKRGFVEVVVSKAHLYANSPTQNRVLSFSLL